MYGPYCAGNSAYIDSDSPLTKTAMKDKDGNLMVMMALNCLSCLFDSGLSFNAGFGFNGGFWFWVRPCALLFGLVLVLVLNPWLDLYGAMLVVVAL